MQTLSLTALSAGPGQCRDLSNTLRDGVQRTLWQLEPTDVPLFDTSTGKIHFSVYERLLASIQQHIKGELFRLHVNNVDGSVQFVTMTEHDDFNAGDKLTVPLHH